MFGKVKTCLQIAAILAVIAVHGQPLWVSALLYITAAVTVLSGLDYFFGLRRRMQQAGRRRRQLSGPARSHSDARARRVQASGARGEPLIEARLARRACPSDLLAQLREQAVTLGHDVVLMDRLEVLLARGDEVRTVQRGEHADDAGDHLANAVLDEARAAMGLLDDGDLIRALHQLVYLRGHAALGDLQQRRRVDLRGLPSMQPI